MTARPPMSANSGSRGATSAKRATARYGTLLVSGTRTTDSPDTNDPERCRVPALDDLTTASTVTREVERHHHRMRHLEAGGRSLEWRVAVDAGVADRPDCCRRLPASRAK